MCDCEYMRFRVGRVISPGVKSDAMYKQNEPSEERWKRDFQKPKCDIAESLVPKKTTLKTCHRHQKC